jgi:murein DD-endopeptidase MepM/ murein hydrolase activator NlpD
MFVSGSRTLKLLSLSVALVIPMSSFSQNENKQEQESPERVELNYKQQHSKLGNTANQHLYADGIKIKRDLTILKEAQEQRILSEDEIPAEELYGGVWINNRVNAYGEVLKNAPDTFTVDLTNFTMPTMGHVTSNFGMRRRRMHYGIDLKVQVGDTIYAAFDGKIRVKQYERRGYGYYLVVRHTNGLETVYGHLSKFLVEEGTVVKSGDPIALGGNTGRSSGSHLHFEVRYIGRPMNPTEIIDFDNKVCHKDSYTITPKVFNVRGSRFADKNAVVYASRSSSTSTNKYASGDVAYHRIKSGETLSTIARKYGLSINQLCKLNNITSKTVIRAGKSLRVS